MIDLYEEPYRDESDPDLDRWHDALHAEVIATQGADPHAGCHVWPCADCEPLIDRGIA